MSSYRIKVFRDIDDQELKEAWAGLQSKNNVFPQMHYSWLEGWCKYSSKAGSLYIVCVQDLDNKIVGIAPFFIQRKMGANLLHSAPRHFGDYYDYILDGTVSDEVFSVINRHVLSYKEWSCIRLDLIRSRKMLENLDCRVFKTRVQSKILEARLTDNVEEYTASLSQKVRSEYFRRLKKLRALGDVEFLVSSDPLTYEKYEKEFREIYEKRWKDIDKVLPGDSVYAYRKHALMNLCKQGDAVIVCLLLDKKLIAYRFGIIFENKYFDYKISFDPNYSKYGLGSIITGLLVSDLIDKRFSAIDHGVGDYKYKRDWSPDLRITEVYQAIASKPASLGFLYAYYELSLKEKLKHFYSMSVSLLSWLRLQFKGH